MSFLKKLFGGGDKTPKEISSDPIDYNGFTIKATPFAADGQYQSCGVISKTINGEVCEHRFIRADKFASTDVAFDMITIKARQIIDEQGDNLFK